MIPTREVLILGHNHFDPMWRRCFLADAVYNGVTVKSYADIEEKVLSAWLNLAPSGYTFTEGQAVVLREWLRRDPLRLGQLKSEIALGRFSVVQAGETVQDSNLPSAEGLVRNFLVAQPLWRELGVENTLGLEIAWLEDAFGNSANYPQVLRGVGCKVAAKLSYRGCPDEVWVGIDGTALPVLDHVPQRYHGSVVKYPPCDSCAGTGCIDCQHSGLRLLPLLDREVFERALRDAMTGAVSSAAAFQGWDAAVVGSELPALTIGGEETLPEQSILDAVAAVSSECPQGVSIRWATWTDLWLKHRDRLLAKAVASNGTATPELNPAMPGCMVTRRLTKTRTRDVAYRLVEAESHLADESWRGGAPIAPPTDFARAWEQVAFAQFHDGITGTHIDAANREMLQFLDEAEAVAAPHLPAVRPFSATPWRPHSGNEDTLRLGHLDLRFDRLGILSVSVKGRELLSAQTVTPTMHALRIGELTLESDFGDAWGQRISPLGDSSMRGLGEFHDTVEVTDDAIRWCGCYRGGHRKVHALTWTVEVRASADGERLDFTCSVDWDTESKRLRAVFPMPCQDPSWLGEIPFGFIERRFDAALTDWSQWNAQQNEYPILHWAQHRSPDGSAVALITDGLPCVRWQPGRFDLSLLRSPEWEFCSVEPAHYEFWDTDGQRDTGRHEMRWSLWPAAMAQEPTVLTAAGYTFNRPSFVQPPFRINGEVIATAWKPAEDGEAWILRLQETSGNGGEVVLDFAEERTVTPCDLLERPGFAGSIGVPGQGRHWSTRLHRHGILTLRIR